MSEKVKIYVNVPGRNAAYSAYNYVGAHVVTLFECPREWIPQNQLQFEQACAFHGITHSNRLRWENRETF